MSNGPPGRASGITVVARVRPPSEMERARGDSESVRCLDDRTVQVGPRQLTFDAALGGSNQQHVFERTDMRQLLDAALQGYAATVFAYGQTGSGKTFTMSGPEGIADRAASAEGSAGDGIIPRAVRYLFNALDAHRSGRAGVSYAVSASYLEIYNEQINDLLNPASTGLPIRWNAQQGFFVEGLLVVDCETVDELMMVFREGTKNRTVRARLSAAAPRACPAAGSRAGSLTPLPTPRARARRALRRPAARDGCGLRRRSARTS